MKHAEAPGALVEIGFLSNVEERELLKKEDYQQQMAASIYQGILRYVTEDRKKQDWNRHHDAYHLGFHMFMLY